MKLALIITVCAAAQGRRCIRTLENSVASQVAIPFDALFPGLFLHRVGVLHNRRVMRTARGAAAVVLLLSTIISCISAATVNRGIQAELDSIVAVIPAGGPHNEMAMRTSRHWRKVRCLPDTMITSLSLSLLAATYTYLYTITV